jgi:hypothetical protein
MFSPELRRDVVEYSNALQVEAEASPGEIASELGLNGWTLQRWHQNARKTTRGGASFVEVTAEKRRQSRKASVVTSAAFKVTCPSGFEVRVPASFDARAFKSLLNAIEGR